MTNVRIAQVGCGYWGRNLARNFHDLGILAGVVDADQVTATAMSVQLEAPVLTLCLLYTSDAADE